MRPILQLSHIASLGTIALLLLMVACGTAAPATPSASQAEPPVDASATAVPTAGIFICNSSQSRKTDLDDCWLGQ